MSPTVDRDPSGGSPEKRPPRFGSYIGLVYVAAILGVLGFAILRDPGTGHALPPAQAGDDAHRGGRPPRGTQDRDEVWSCAPFRSGGSPTASRSRWPSRRASFSRRSASPPRTAPGSPGQRIRERREIRLCLASSAWLMAAFQSPSISLCVLAATRCILARSAACRSRRPASA